MRPRLAILILSALFAISCSTGTSDDESNINNLSTHFEEVKSDLPRDDTPDITDAEFRIFVDGAGDFALDLYRQAVLTADPDANLVFSPFSISTALAMTWAGARGSTEAEMADVLHFPLEQELMHAGFNRLIASMEDKGTGDASELAIDIANSVWAQEGFPLETPFVDTLGLNYGAGINLLDFASAPGLAKDVINAWVEVHTAGLIKDLISKLSPDTRLVLVNAIHFLGKWRQPFDESLTEGHPFTSPTTTYVTDFMSNHATYHFAEGADWKALELDYADEDLSMLIVLPDATAFDTFESTLDATRLNGIIDALSPVELMVRIPLFEFESNLPLTQMLKDMGMNAPFADADFSGISTAGPLVISDVLHKAVIAVDEKRTEAAAATAVVVVNNSAGGGVEVREFIADHPFLFFIRDRVTGGILFMGRVSHPTIP